jgi:hypothetical protein
MGPHGLVAANRRDPVTATVSASRVFTNDWGASVFVTGGTAALRGYDVPLSLGAALTRLGNGKLWGLTPVWDSPRPGRTSRSAPAGGSVYNPVSVILLYRSD